VIQQMLAVLESPRSLRARHALADYWLSVDDPRGKLLNNRLQQQERDLTVSLGFLSSQYHSLLRKYETEWTAPIRAIAASCDLGLGLVAYIAISGETLAARGSEILQLAPIIAFCITPPFELERVLATGVLGNAVDLTFGESRDFDDSMAVAVAECQSLRQLRMLRLPELGIVTAHGLSALANSNNLPDLISIEVTGNPCAQSGGVMRNDDRDYYVCAAGESFLAEAQHDMLLSSDPMVLHWPPLFDQYAWLP
jgi:hypothetical protein